MAGSRRSRNVLWLCQFPCAQGAVYLLVFVLATKELTSLTNLFVEIK